MRKTFTNAFSYSASSADHRAEAAFPCASARRFENSNIAIIMDTIMVIVSIFVILALSILPVIIVNISMILAIIAIVAIIALIVIIEPPCAPKEPPCLV